MDLMENLAWMDFTWVCVMYCFIFKPNQRGSVTGKKVVRFSIRRKRNNCSTKCNLLGNGYTLFLSKSYLVEI